MAKPRFIIFLVLLAILKFCGCFLTNNKQIVIKSFNKELNIKHLNIVKDFDFQVTYKILNFVKKLSEERIYASALSVKQMNESFYKYYYTTASDYFDAIIRRQKKLLNRNVDFYNKRINLVYPPKTLAILYGENLKEIIHYLFIRANEISLSKFIWLIVDNFNESYLNPELFYVPYNSQFFILKKFTEEKNNYFIDELYHPSRYSSVSFHNRFGTWETNKGFKIFVSDIFKRRFDLNGTIFAVLESQDNYFKTAINLKIASYLILHEVLQILNINLVTITQEKLVNSSYLHEIILKLKVYDFLSPYPFRINLLVSENKYLHIAYDKKYEGQDGVLTLLRPFSYKLWLGLVFCIGISTITLTIIYCFTDNSFTTIFNGFYEPFESFLNQCSYEPPERHSNRILTLANRLAALFIVPAYTGAILSFILIPTFKYPFRNMQEFVEDGSYQLAYIDEETPLGLYSQETNDIYIKIAYEKLSVTIKKENPDMAIQDGVRKICNDHKSALLIAEMDSKITDVIGGLDDCKILKIPSPSYPHWLKFDLRHGCPYLKLLNRILSSFKSNGIFKRILYDAEDFWGNYKLMSNNNDDKVDPVDIDSLKSIFIITGIFYAISTIILIGEIIFKKLKILK